MAETRQRDTTDLAMRIWRGLRCIDNPCKSLPGCGCVDFIVQTLEDDASRARPLSGESVMVPRNVIEAIIGHKTGIPVTTDIVAYLSSLLGDTPAALATSAEKEGK